MNRKLIVGLGLFAVLALRLLAVLALCLLAVMGWHGRQYTASNNPGEGQVSLSASATPAAPAEEVRALEVSSRAAASEAQEPSYLKYRVRYGLIFDGPQIKTINGGARVGYAKVGDEAFYAWKCVSVETRRIPGLHALSFSEAPVDLARMKVVEIDPPVYYQPVSEGICAPGYYRASADRSTFYRWRGVTLKHEQIPGRALSKRLLTAKSAEYTMDIDPPKHVVERPELWKKE